MTLFLLVLLAAALLAPSGLRALAQHQRRAALDRFGRRVTARRGQIQADISRAAHDLSFSEPTRLRLLSGLHAERVGLDLRVGRVALGEVNPDQPLPARPQHQWRPRPTDTVVSCSHGTTVSGQGMKDHYLPLLQEQA